jgi:hypothetical protein
MIRGIVILTPADHDALRRTPDAKGRAGEDCKLFAPRDSSRINGKLIGVFDVGYDASTREVRHLRRVWEVDEGDVAIVVGMQVRNIPIALNAGGSRWRTPAWNCRDAICSIRRACAGVGAVWPRNVFDPRRRASQVVVLRHATLCELSDAMSRSQRDLRGEERHRAELAAAGVAAVEKADFRIIYIDCGDAVDCPGLSPR